MFLNHEHKFSSQYSGALSVTNVLGTPFLAKTIYKICCTVSDFLSWTLKTLGHAENTSTNIRHNPIPFTCAWSMWTLGHSSVSFGHKCVSVLWKICYFCTFRTFIQIHLHITSVTRPPGFQFYTLCSSYSTIHIIMHTFDYLSSTIFWWYHQISIANYFCCQFVGSLCTDFLL